MRRLALLGLVVVVAAGCGGGHNTSEPTPRLYSTTGKTGEAPGGPPTLVRTGRHVVGKGLLVVGTPGSAVIVRKPKGGRLLLLGAARRQLHDGDRVSFTGTGSATQVRVASLSVIHR